MSGQEQPQSAAPAALVWSTRLGFCVLALLVLVRMLNAAALFPRGKLDASTFEAAARSTPHAREVRFTATDGVRLYGWVCGAEGAPRKLVFCCGNGGNVSGYGPRMAQAARALGAQVLVFDYRGYYLSEGTPCEAGLYSDARGAWLYATRELKWKPARTFVWGHSLGAAVATALVQDLEADAARHAEAFGARQTPPTALILESPFTSVADMARRQFAFLGAPHWLTYTSMDNAARVKELRLPLFIMHGRADEIIPCDMGQELCALGRNVTPLWIENGTHNELWSTHQNAISAALDQFLKQHER